MDKKNDSPIMLLTAAPRRFGKAIAGRLAQEGFDVALFGSEPMKAPASVIEQHGQRGLAVQTNASDPVSVRSALDEVHRELGPINLLVHLAPLELGGPPEKLDACTEGLVPELRDSGGVVVYVLAADEVYPRERAQRLLGEGIHVSSLRVISRVSQELVADAVMMIWREPQTFAPRAHTVDGQRQRGSPTVSG